MSTMHKVAIIMGSDSDFDCLKPCLKTLKKFGITFEAMVCSAHRTPEKAAEFAKTAKDNGFEVIIAAAGKAAHLPGVMAAFTTLPVIGIPVKSSTMDGLDSLLSIVQMPSGIPVATVAIDGAENAALLAIQMMAIADGDLSKKLSDFKDSLEKKVNEKNEKLQEKIAEI